MWTGSRWVTTPGERGPIGLLKKPPNALQGPPLSAARHHDSRKDGPFEDAPYRELILIQEDPDILRQDVDGRDVGSPTPIEITDGQRDWIRARQEAGLCAEGAVAVA